MIPQSLGSIDIKNQAKAPGASLGHLCSTTLGNMHPFRKLDVICASNTQISTLQIQSKARPKPDRSQSPPVQS